MQRIVRQLNQAQQLELLVMLMKCYPQLDVVANANILDNPNEITAREELERQTELFMNHVLNSFLPLIAGLSLNPIIHILTLLMRRQSFPLVAKSQVIYPSSIQKMCI
jgi:DNA topoisomerase 2-associated protein PAT1